MTTLYGFRSYTTFTERISSARSVRRSNNQTNDNNVKIKISFSDVWTSQAATEELATRNSLTLNWEIRFTAYSVCLLAAGSETRFPCPFIRQSDLWLRQLFALCSTGRKLLSFCSITRGAPRTSPPPTHVPSDIESRARAFSECLNALLEMQNVLVSLLSSVSV